MRAYLTNRKDVTVFHNGIALDILVDKGREFVEFDVDDGEEYKLDFVRRSEFSGPMWFLRAMLFWIIGIMGFFTPRYSKNTFSLDCTLTAVAGDKPLIIMFNNVNPKYAPPTAFKISDKDSGAVLENVKYVEDKEAKSRRKIYALTSTVARLAVIAVAAVIIIKKIIG